MAEWPTPRHDTGLGVHGSSDCHNKPADFMGRVAQYKERGISWKLLFCCDQSKADWAKVLVDNDIMPILRIWPTYAPGLKFDIAHLEAYRDVGVKWFIIGNELNNDYEWEEAQPPGRDAAYKVAESYAQKADITRQRGMWPMTPAPSLGGTINHRKFFRYFMERIAQLGNPLSILYPGGIGLHCRSVGNPLEAQYTWYDCSADEWRWSDAVVKEYCGRSLPMANTEAFDEPDWLPKLPDGNYDWDLWRARNLTQFRWFDPNNAGYRYPNYVICNCFWLLKSQGFLTAWDEDGLIDNNAYARQTGRGLVTHLWESMKGYVNWTRGDTVQPPSPLPQPPPPAPPMPDEPVEIEFVGLSEEMIAALSISGPADATAPYWKVSCVEIQSETNNMSVWVMCAKQAVPPLLFWASGEAPMNWKPPDPYAPPGARDGAYEQPLGKNGWGSYGVRMPANSEALFGFGLYEKQGDVIVTTMTGHHPTLIYYRLAQPSETPPGPPPQPEPPVPPEPIPDHRAKGLDVSQWQGVIDWVKAAAGHSFVYIRASVGLRTDPRFAENVQGAQANGLLCGAYHYLEIGANAAEQALAFLEAIGDFELELPPMLDVEDDGLTQDMLRAFVVAFGKPLGCYSSVWRWNDALHLGGDNLHLNPLWTAHWTTGSIPRLPTAWQAWAFWQYTSEGAVDGIVGNVDLDRYNGTVEELRAAYALPADPLDVILPLAEEKLGAMPVPNDWALPAAAIAAGYPIQVGGYGEVLIGGQAWAYQTFTRAAQDEYVFAYCKVGDWQNVKVAVVLRD